MAGVEAVIGGAFVSAIIKEVVKAGRSYFADKYKKHKNTRGMLNNLEASLPLILEAIEFAEQETTALGANLREWLRQLKDVTHEAEDVMDDFEAKRIGLKNKGKVSEIASSVRSVILSDKDEKKLQNLIGKIDNLCNRVGAFTKMIESRNKEPIDGLNITSNRETTSFISETEKIFGREVEIKVILERIIHYPKPQSYISYFGSGSRQDPDLVYSDNESTNDYPSPISEETSSPFLNATLEKEASKIKHSPSTSRSLYANTSIFVGKRRMSVLPIVGIGGVGKTTIAKVIYNHPEVQAQFDLQVWVYVAENIDRRKIVQDILCSLGVNITITTLEIGYRELKNAIREKKFLIIFDDIREGRGEFDDSTWKEVLKVLAEIGTRGSTVIATTEIKSIADTLGTLPPVYLNVLDWGEFLALFEYHAFSYSNSKTRKPCDKTVLKPIGKKIAEKLGGLPLAAKVIGNLLSRNPNKDYWETILNTNWWDHEEVSKKILIALGTSFQNLDPDLKQCFMFCSLFPKNYVFDKDRLVQMWMAHGFIHPTTGAENIKLETNELKMEDIGRWKFDKLVDRFFFQTTVFENRYVIHDLIRDFAIATSFEMLYVSSNHLIENKKIPSSVRHLSIDPNIGGNFYVNHMQWSDNKIQSLRTILFFGFVKMIKDEGLQGILDKMGGLRLLNLSYIIMNPKGLVDNIIGKLSHMRFLDLSFSRIIEVPSSLCQLVHLQVLDMRGCQFSKLPTAMNRLINLRHLYASPHTISLIRWIGRLTNLQELEEFHVKTGEGFTISELKDLKSLQGQLTLKYLKKVTSQEMACTAALDDKKFLTSLIFNYDMGRSRDPNFKHVEVLEGLKPHNNIRELKILEFHGNSFPSWIMNIHEMNNLRSIELKHCLHVESLTPLGSLPKLEVLILENFKSIICIGEEFYGSSDEIFPSLKELAFSGLSNWKRWLHTGKGQILFPCLEKFKIADCEELSEAPLHCLRLSMVELHLSSCYNVAKSIGKYLANMTSLRKLHLEASQYAIDLCCDNLGELRDLTLRNIRILPHLEGQSCSLVNLKTLCFHSWSWENSFDIPPIQSVLAQHMHCLPSLTSIEVHYCNGLPKVLLSLGRLPLLHTLLINYNFETKAEKFTSEEESWLLGLASLEEMEITGSQHLRHLPTSLSTLPSLRKFTLKDCPRIHSLPEEGLPKSLKELHIIRCSDTLIQGCEPNTGEEWSKISHIPYIRVHSKKRRALTNYDRFQ